MTWLILPPGEISYYAAVTESAGERETAWPPSLGGMVRRHQHEVNRAVSCEWGSFWMSLITVRVQRPCRTKFSDGFRRL